MGFSVLSSLLGVRDGANEFLSRWMGPNAVQRNYNKEFRYPDRITLDNLTTMHQREGIAARVVKIYPEWCWIESPNIYETEDQNQTPWELAWNAFVTQHHVYSRLELLDELSGIGNYGVLLIGFDDGLPLSQPLLPKAGRKVTFLRPLSQKHCQIASVETDPFSPRYRMPTMYNLRLHDDDTDVGIDGVVQSMESVTVHHSRVLHVADNRLSSDVYGMPRLFNVYNRVLDIIKLLGGSAEMYYQGALPGIATDIDPEYATTLSSDESAALKNELHNYREGLQRILLLRGIKITQLQPTVVSPNDQLENQYKALGISIGVPWRILLGSEEARLASDQDRKNWNAKVRKRCNTHVATAILRPFIEILTNAGVLPIPSQAPIIDWGDLDTPSDQDKAEVADKVASALSRFVSGNADAMMTPYHFLTLFLGLSEAEARSIEQELDAQVSTLADDSHEHELTEEEADDVV